MQPRNKHARELTGANNINLTNRDELTQRTLRNRKYIRRELLGTE
jgi:hypothetical protein